LDNDILKPDELPCNEFDGLCAICRNATSKCGKAFRAALLKDGVVAKKLFECPYDKPWTGIPNRVVRRKIGLKDPEFNEVIEKIRKRIHRQACEVSEDGYCKPFKLEISKEECTECQSNFNKRKEIIERFKEQVDKTRKVELCIHRETVVKHGKTGCCGSTKTVPIKIQCVKFDKVVSVERCYSCDEYQSK